MAEDIVFDNKFVNRRLRVLSEVLLRCTKSRLFLEDACSLTGVRQGKERKKQLKPRPSGSPSHR